MRRLGCDGDGTTTGWNNDPRPFSWTRSADEIPETLAEYCQRITGLGAAR
jgi:hypothetical protein